jgi:hypothetical protein
MDTKGTNKKISADSATRNSNKRNHLIQLMIIVKVGKDSETGVLPEEALLAEMTG